MAEGTAAQGGRIMGWGTCYIESEGYLNRITIEQIDDEITAVLGPTAN